MHEIRVGLIGYKFMGKAHSNALNQVAKFFSLKAKPVLKAVCGRDEAGVSAAALKYGFESYETDWRKLIAREDIDLVDITTPNNSHAEIAVAAAKAGKHIICEKPLAMNVKECQEMVKAAKENKVINMVCFNYRRVPAVALAKKLIEDGVIGKIYHFRAVYLQDWIVDPSFPLVWRLQKKNCGSGVLGDLAAHIVDAARFLVGDISKVNGMWETFIKERPLSSEVSGLSARSAKKHGKATGKVDVDDAVIFMAKFENGALGTFEATRFAPGRKNALKWEINGSKGSIVFELERMNELQVYLKEDEKKGINGFRTINVTESIHPYINAYWPSGHIIGYEHSFINTVKDLLDGIAVGKNPKPDFADGLECQKVMESVEKSIRTGSWVNV